MLEQVLRQLEKEFSISQSQILSIASCFQEHLELGLSRGESTLKMLPSYLQAPKGNEAGTFIALDFGGSNVRAAAIELKEEGGFLELYKLSRPLFDADSKRDLRTSAVTAKELFNFLAEIIQEVLINSPVNSSLISSTSGPLPLGFAFSFPYRQKKLGEGILLNWDKEVKTSGVVGKDVGQLLIAALEGRGLGSVVQPIAIVNDTVANFLAAAYKDPNVDIATIIGTGHNTSYLEQKTPGFDTPVIINTESGNFSAVPQTSYDQLLDQESDNPREQQFEKMLSGKYLGELFRLIVFDLFQQRLQDSILYPFLSHWNQPYTVSGQDLASILAGKSEEDVPDCHLPHISGDQRLALQRIAKLLTKRSARLAASSLIGIVRHLDPHFDNSHTVGVDGSLYEGMPGYAQELTTALREGLEGKAGQVRVKLSAGGSLIGAAIAAAQAAALGGINEI